MVSTGIMYKNIFGKIPGIYKCSEYVDVLIQKGVRYFSGLKLPIDSHKCEKNCNAEQTRSQIIYCKWWL